MEIWSGDKTLAWGSSGMISLAAAAFADATDEVTLVLYYEPVATAEYTDIQMCYKDWSKASFKVGETSVQGDFNPRGYYGVTTGSLITPFTFDDAALQSFKRQGMIIQGYGVRLTKIVIAQQQSAAVTPPALDTTAPLPAFSLGGIREKKRDGQRYLKKQNCLLRF